MSESASRFDPPSVEGVVTRPSPFSVESTLERLRTTILGHGLTVFATIDHSGEAERAGLTMQPAKLLIFGNPRAGTPLMIASPLLALELPLKALVWQGGDGRVWVSAISAASLQARYAIPPELIGNIAGADALLAQALHADPPAA